MIPSKQNPWFLYSTTIAASLILQIHFFHIPGVEGANFTIVNNCSETIWAVVDGDGAQVNITPGKRRGEISAGGSLAFQTPSSGWTGRVWGKTGCTFNELGSDSCTTGDGTTYTLAEFGLQQPQSLDVYDVSLATGFNLPMLVQPSGGCESAGCPEDVNRWCPAELRTAAGAACRSPCDVFGTQEYCCSGGVPCGPTNYSRLFKKVCPKAYSYPLDDANTTFTCKAGAHYSIIFCPLHNSSLVIQQARPPAPAPTPADNIPSPAKGFDHSRKNRAKEIVTIVSLGASSVIVVFIVTCCLLKRRHSQNEHTRNRERQVENLLLQHGSLAPKRYRFSEIKKMTKSFTDKLGQGGYGSVYKGMLSDGRLVAVKILIETDSNGEEFINEVTSISKTYHVNIVSLLGFCYEGNKRALVYEFMPNKSLDKFLTNRGSADCFLDWNQLYKIAVGIAKGLEYLHTGCITRIVHFDIKPQNILLDEEFCPKISDFGLAQLCKKKQSILSVVGTRGTAGYIAPEVFSRNFGGVSHKSDVYSYGMMLLEMGGAKRETQSEANQSSENYFPDKIYEQVISDVTKGLNELMMEEEEERRKKLLVIGFWCIQTNPWDRPSISKVVEMLEGSVEAIQIPPKPFLFSPVIPDQQYSSSSSSVSQHVQSLKPQSLGAD